MNFSLLNNRKTNRFLKSKIKRWLFVDHPASLLAITSLKEKMYTCNYKRYLKNKHFSFYTYCM